MVQVTMSSEPHRGDRAASSLPPVHHSFVETSSLRIHCAEVVGVGPPLIMLHGIGMDWRVWQAISRRLVPFFHLYLLDLRGHGQSDKPAQGYSLAHYAADVEDIVDQLRLNGAILLGSSLGGMVAATVEAPADLVTHRILVDPPLTGGPVRDREMFQDIRVLKHEPVQALAEYLRRSNPGAGHFLMRTMAEMWHEAADGVIDDLLARSEDYFTIDSALRLIESPTLLLQADPALGGVLSTEEARRALDILPHGSLVQVPGAGHAIHAYKPVEFVRIVLQFVGLDAARQSPSSEG
jgi:pimeloyl-ACP methyl ester carboxylesterase